MYKIIAKEKLIDLLRHFNLDPRRIDSFVKIIMAVITLRKINLKEIALSFDDNILIESREKKSKDSFLKLNCVISALQSL